MESKRLIDLLLEVSPSVVGKRYSEVGCPHEYGFESSSAKNKETCNKECMRCWLRRLSEVQSPNDEFQIDEAEFNAFLMG